MIRISQGELFKKIPWRYVFIPSRNVEIGKKQIENDRKYNLRMVLCTVQLFYLILFYMLTPASSTQVHISDAGSHRIL
jgi:hypothetical protein